MTSNTNTTTSVTAIWDDTTTDLNGNNSKRNVPALPKVGAEYGVVYTEDMAGLIFLMYQIVRTKDKLVLMRAIASAASSVLKDKFNYTGSSAAPVMLDGLAVLDEDNLDVKTPLKTNFLDAEPVLVEDILAFNEIDPDELGAYFGVLFLAGNKLVTTQNRTAFNERRVAAATASVIGDAKLFIPDSIFLHDTVLKQVYASFLSFSPLRANMTARVVSRLSAPHMGSALAFTSMFLLLVDSGMSALKIIKEATMKYAWVRTEFPDLMPEMQAAHEGQAAIRRAPIADRPFLKAIHGNNFVPADYSSIDNLMGVCKEIMKRTTPSYANYGGGKVSPQQMSVINKHLNAEVGTSVDDVAAE